MGQTDLMLQLKLSENGNLYKTDTLKKLAGFSQTNGNLNVNFVTLAPKMVSHLFASVL